MPVHQKLKHLYKHARECEGCAGCKDKNNQCILYVSCGPVPGCKPVPCKKCLFWKGYGLEHDLNDACLKWVEEKTRELTPQTQPA